DGSRAPRRREGQARQERGGAEGLPDRAGEGSRRSGVPEKEDQEARRFHGFAVKAAGPGGALPFLLGALVLLGRAGPPRSGTSPLPEVPESVPGFSALAAVKWKSPQRSGHARVALAYRSPDQVRLEMLDPMGNSRTVLVATERGALLLDPLRHSYRS